VPRERTRRRVRLSLHRRVPRPGATSSRS